MSESLGPKTRDEWRDALEALPATPDKIPAFFFAHGSPMLAFPQGSSNSRSDELLNAMGPKSNLALFLSDFGPTLLRKYKPKGIVVFSAHWETDGQRLGMLPLFTMGNSGLKLFSD
jgi:aromatic ring-opening dioxygenase catalytic subunit (LigB family)